MRGIALASALTWLLLGAFATTGMAQGTVVFEYVDPDKTGEAVQKINEEQGKLHSEIEEVQSEALEQLLDKIKLASTALTTAVDRIRKARERHNKLMKPESELEMITSIRQALDEVLEKDLLLPESILDKPADVLDNSKERLRRLADSSVQRNEKYLHYREEAVQKRASLWKKLDAKAQAGIITPAEEREMASYGRWIRDTHNMVQMSRKQLSLFRQVQANINQVIDRQRTQWDDARNFLENYNASILNLRELRELYKQAEEVQRFAMLADVEILADLDRVAETSRDLSDVVQQPMLEIFSGVGSFSTDRTQVDTVPVDRDEVLNILSEY